MKRFIGLCIGATVALGLAGCSPGQVSKAQDTLTLHYLKQGIYDPAVCRSKEVNSQYFIRCTSVGGRVGGLYLIAFNDNSFTIHPVNGKAMTHAKNLAIGSVATNIDITTVLQSF